MKVVLQVLVEATVDGDFCSNTCDWILPRRNQTAASCALYRAGLSLSGKDTFWRCGGCRDNERSVVGRRNS